MLWMPLGVPNKFLEHTSKINSGGQLRCYVAVFQQSKSLHYSLIYSELRKMNRENKLDDI